jgi:hypothetical protein
MREQIGYCWQKAAEYAARAQEAPDKETRELFIRFRNSWLSAARRYQASSAPVAGTSAQLRPAALTPEPGTSAWHTRSSDGLTSVPAERRGAG